MDLHIIKLKSGAELLCKNYYDIPTSNEYRVEVLNTSSDGSDYDYIISKEAIESVMTYSNCYLKSISGDNFTDMPDNRFFTTTINIPALAALVKEKN